MSLPTFLTGEIWIFENDITNNPHEDDYLGPVLILNRDAVGKNYSGQNYEVLELLTGDYTNVRVDRANYKYWRQLA